MEYLSYPLSVMVWVELMNKVNYMTIQPLFSVLIANYNNGKYLMDAIESVRSQTYSKWEIILVDDASTDNSADLYVWVVDTQSADVQS